MKRDNHPTSRPEARPWKRTLPALLITVSLLVAGMSTAMGSHFYYKNGTANNSHWYGGSGTDTQQGGSAMTPQASARLQMRIVEVTCCPGQTVTVLESQPEPGFYMEWHTVSQPSTESRCRWYDFLGSGANHLECSHFH